MNGFEPCNCLHFRALCCRFFGLARLICCIAKPGNFEVGDYFENIFGRNAILRLLLKTITPFILRTFKLFIVHFKTVVLVKLVSRYEPRSLTGILSGIGHVVYESQTLICHAQTKHMCSSSTRFTSLDSNYVHRRIFCYGTLNIARKIYLRQSVSYNSYFANFFFCILFSLAVLWYRNQMVNNAKTYKALLQHFYTLRMANINEVTNKKIKIYFGPVLQSSDTHTHTHTHTHRHIYSYMYMCVHIYIYI